MKDGTPDSIGPGASITYTITVTNNSAITATGVWVYDGLSEDVTYTGSSASQGSYDSTTGVWTIGTVAQGDVATLTIIVSASQVVHNGAIVDNFALVYSDQPDSNPGNNEALDSAVVVIIYPPVPGVTQWGLILMAASILGLFTLRARRKARGEA